MTNHQNVPPVSPSVRRAQLGSELRRIRNQAGLNGDEVAAGMFWSASKLSRYELARTGLKTGDVAALLAYYQVPDAEAARLMVLAEEATRKGWWETSAHAGLTAEYQTLIALEYEAASIGQWAVTQIPALLQTEAYARHVVTSWSLVDKVPPGQVSRLVATRLARQAVRNRPDTQMTFVLDESVMHRCIGGPAVMAAQMTAAAAAAEDGITIRVLPAAPAPQAGLPEFTLLRLPDHLAGDGAVRDTAVHETPGDGYHLVEDEMRTFLLGIAFDRLTGSAASEADSLAILTAAATRWTRQVS